MSASVVPSLYDAIVDEVVTQSRQDFLDDGVPEDILQDFKARWQTKIAASGATAAPAAPAAPETTLNDDHVKLEDSTNGASPATSFPQGGNALAAMRAAQQAQLQARSNGGLQQQQQADAAVAHLLQQQQQAQQMNGTSTTSNANASPSSGDYMIKAEPDLVASQDLLAQNSTSAAVSQGTTATTTANGKKRSLSLKSETERHGASSSTAHKSKKQKAPRPDIDLDDEAINSDLDDSDDDALRADGEDEDDGDVQTVLCLFDKVQRTKNKWKCVLKDGIVNVNGRDFAFNKANGEFEW